MKGPKRNAHDAISVNPVIAVGYVDQGTTDQTQNDLCRCEGRGDQPEPKPCHMKDQKDGKGARNFTV